MKMEAFKNIYQSTLSFKQSVVKGEIDELIDNFELYEEDFAKEWLHDNEDWLNEKGINEDCLSDMISECIESYCYNEQYRNLYLSETAIKYMKNKLPENYKKIIDFHVRINKYEDTSEIIKMYLRNNYNYGG